jgi:hypothetical protein
MSKTLSIVVGAALLLGSAALLAAQQTKEEVVAAKAQKARGAGADENIKKGTALNDPTAVVPAPPGKGGAKSRGVACGIVLDNWTQWYVQFYVDSLYWGAAGPYGEVTGLAFSGPTKVYARADFTDGTWLYWGPQVFNCRHDEIYRWKVGQ